MGIAPNSCRNNAKPDARRAKGGAKAAAANIEASTKITATHSAVVPRTNGHLSSKAPKSAIEIDVGGIDARSGQTVTPDAHWSTEGKTREPLSAIRLGDLLIKPAPSRRWLVEGWLPAGQVTLVAGDGGIGKTTIALQLAASVATGTEWLGLTVAKRGRVAVLSAEDDIDELHWRFAQIARSIPGSHDETLEQLNDVLLIDASGDLDPTLANFDEKNGLKLTDTLARLKEFLASEQIDVLILDSAADVFSEEINRYAVRSFMRLIRGLADTVILLGHPSVSGMKDGRGYSGSTHWNNAVRSRLRFEVAKDPEGGAPDPDLRILELAKANRARGKQIMSLRWTEAGFMRDDEAASGVDALSRRLKAEDTFLKLVKLFNEQGRHVNPSTSRTGAPVLFAKHPDNKGFTKSEFEHAMETLLGAGKIQVVTEGPPSKQIQRLKAKEAPLPNPSEPIFCAFRSGSEPHSEAVPNGFRSLPKAVFPNPPYPPAGEAPLWAAPELAHGAPRASQANGRNSSNGSSKPEGEGQAHRGARIPAARWDGAI